MATKRFQPLSTELGGYIKTFFILWIIIFIIIFMALGGGKWALWSGVAVGFLITIPCFVVTLVLTGVKE